MRKRGVNNMHKNNGGIITDMCVYSEGLCIQYWFIDKPPQMFLSKHYQAITEAAFVCTNTNLGETAKNIPPDKML